MSFTAFRNVIDTKFKQLTKHDMFVVDLSKTDVWDAYLSNFKPEDNPVFLTNTEHDCNCCKQFIRDLGRVVIIKDDLSLDSIWNVKTDDVYQPVVDALHKLVSSSRVLKPFLHYEDSAGTKHNHKEYESGVVQWNHFYSDIPTKFVSSNRATVISDKTSTQKVLLRGLNDITQDSLDTVKELIAQGSLYRGDEHLGSINGFSALKNEFDDVDDSLKNNYVWSKLEKNQGLSRFKNSVIGKLVYDIATDVPLEDAVKMFDSMVAPANYKRPKALVTKGMISKAEEAVKELGISESLQRRYTNLDDISINNTIFADRTVKEALSVFDDMREDVPVNPKKFDKVEEVHIDKFLADILPEATSLELFFDNKHQNNLVSLINPVNKSAPNILKWDNNCSWSYNGDVTDSMKDRVKSAGGKVDGVLRFSIEWNTSGNDGGNDLDAHCKEPGGHIYFSSPRCHATGGNLDVDITNPRTQAKGGVAVENITWANKNKMMDGVHDFYVHNYSGANKDGFSAEVEYEGTMHMYSYNRNVTSDVKVATVTLKNGNFTIKHHLQPSTASRELWNISTGNFHKVDLITLSPNYWDDNETGNKHWFFILDNCKNDDTTRGLYNEFLSDELHQHRKVFEVLGSKIKAPRSDNQLSGLGFSSTKRDSVLCKINGSFSRVIKINF